MNYHYKILGYAMVLYVAFSLQAMERELLLEEKITTEIKSCEQKLEEKKQAAHERLVKCCDRGAGKESPACKEAWLQYTQAFIARSDHDKVK